ncbi:20913_t:CDS:1, partial [Gigaspora margarita]
GRSSCHERDRDYSEGNSSRSRTKKFILTETIEVVIFFLVEYLCVGRLTGRVKPIRTVIVLRDF